MGAIDSEIKGKKIKMVEECQNQVLQIKLLSEQAHAPVRGSEYAAGLDLMSAENKVIPAKGKATVMTDLSIALPYGTYGRIAPRSGLASKNFIDVGAGVIDCDYRGNVGVLLFNFGEVDFQVKQGDRIAQLIVEKIAMLPVKVVDQLEATARGENGFGSTGTQKLD